MFKRRDPIRKLARSFHYQHLYARARELHGIQIFENVSDLSKIQIEFLYWLALYNRLYQDLLMKEPFLTEETINNDFLCDCYLIWEDKVKRKKELERIKNPARDYSCDKKQIDRSSKIPSVVFKKR